MAVADLDGEPLILPRRDTPAARFRSLIEHLGAGRFAPGVAYELDGRPTVQAFVAAGIAIVPMHGLTLATLHLAPRSVRRPTAPQAAGQRRRPLVAPRTAAVENLLDRLAEATRAYAAARLCRPTQ